MPTLLRLIRKARGAAAEQLALLREAVRQVEADRARARARAGLGGLSNDEIDRRL